MGVQIPNPEQFLTGEKFANEEILTREVSHMKHSDLDEIRICGREKKSKIDLSQLKGHLGNLGGKNQGQKWAYF